ncbi:hypothetical protein [Hymenobacter terricola]|uniref:hypothetical protein n=1 Tax=Hymenobacter terricola TaxID=2819236 RepID=UPI001B308F1F|nr:hypothetical protein [Hymenobacter terricola]
MRPELERLHLIEQQLLQGPAALPSSSWRLRQLLDGELAADTLAQQRLYHGLRLAGRQQLRHELRLIHARLYEGRFAWLRRLWPG